MDLNLPKRSGFEVLETIRASEVWKRLPVLVMSGSSAPGDVIRSYEAGANSYICKPIDLEAIFTTAAQLVAYWGKCVTLPSRSDVGFLARG